MAEATTDSDSDSLSQGALLISCCPTIPVNNLIKKIIATEDIPLPVEKDFDIHRVLCYPLDIKNKYYETKVHLYDIPSKNLISKEFSKCVQAVIIYFNSEDESSLDDVKSWLPFIKEYHTEIKMLVCNQVTDQTALSRDVVLNWCIENDFELVELEPSDDSDDGQEDEEGGDDHLKETIGAQRILQALSAHMWPSMTLKGSHVYKPSAKFAEAIAKEGSPNEDMVNVKDYSDVNTTETGATEDDCFESLFANFSEMKLKASALGEDDRKAYAESVAIAFWKALGGDDDEIRDLDEL